MTLDGLAGGERSMPAMFRELPEQTSGDCEYAGALDETRGPTSLPLFIWMRAGGLAGLW